MQPSGKETLMGVCKIIDEEGNIHQSVLEGNYATEAAQVIISSIRDLCSGYYAKEVISQWCGNKTPENPMAWASCGNTTFLHRHRSAIDGVGMMSASGKILLMYVSPDHTRCGVGSRMLQFMCEHAREAGIDRLTVDAAIPSINFYVRHGLVSIHPIRIGDSPLLDVPMSKVLD